ncbi:hypothetical protein BET03_01105 [Thermohalobacter berrensis]|uniref:Flagellar Assembly Protein A N-terminal region domain-containing protein n=2 Tax=Thermohalobacter berrensis TaxID=99594 RepID=A0A419TBD3_9FIRM|nr:hypothetical protein BET03_01105 [Thermohalobacter berrensis]
MKAYMTLIPPEDGEDLSYDNALKIVEQKIKFGINYNHMKDIINKKQYYKRTLIAEGKLPIDGKDGYIKYFFDTEKKYIPKELEDGSVDFKNLQLINNVKKGDILAEIVPPTEGDAGYTVTGKVLKHKKGKSKKVKLGKNVEYSEDGNKVISLIDGEVILKNGRVHVEKIHKINEDVDNSTGNIQFNGSIKINGNVKTGFKVKAIGDIEIQGVVEGALIESEGNIILKRGIQGHHKGKLNSKGNIIAKYVENAFIECNGLVQADAIMHSDISSNDTVEALGRKGLIVGGTCRAAKEVRAKTIGSSMSTLTTIEVGIDPNLKTKYENLKEENKKIKNNIDKVNKSILLLKRLNDNNRLTKDKKELLIKFIKTKKVLDEQYKKVKKELEEIEYRIECLSKGKIKVSNVVYPGVKIVIGNSTMHVKEEVKACTIYREDGEIKIAHYKE